MVMGERMSLEDKLVMSNDLVVAWEVGNLAIYHGCQGHSDNIVRTIRNIDNYVLTILYVYIGN